MGGSCLRARRKSLPFVTLPRNPTHWLRSVAAQRCLRPVPGLSRHCRLDRRRPNRHSFAAFSVLGVVHSAVSSLEACPTPALRPLSCPAPLRRKGRYRTTLNTCGRSPEAAFGRTNFGFLQTRDICLSGCPRCKAALSVIGKEPAGDRRSKLCSSLCRPPAGHPTGRATRTSVNRRRWAVGSSNPFPPPLQGAS